MLYAAYVVLSCVCYVADDAAPLSESEEEGTTDASSGEDTNV